jgi:putative transposase
MQVGSGGIVFHVMNRAARRAAIFQSPGDYRAFEDVLIAAMMRVPIRLLAYVLMPNHFHLVLWPVNDPDLSCFMQWLTGIHAQRWNRAHGLTGFGAVYQGRFKSIPVQGDVHLWRVCRYVERNPSRAGLVKKASQWRWGSAWKGPEIDPRPVLSEWPEERPANWEEWVDEGMRAEHDDVHKRIQRGIPYGDQAWTEMTADRLHLAGRLRGPGRPGRKQAPKAPARPPEMPSSKQRQHPRHDSHSEVEPGERRERAMPARPVQEAAATAGQELRQSDRRPHPKHVHVPGKNRVHLDVGAQ